MTSQRVTDYQARYLLGRDDVRGSELGSNEGKDGLRPWLVLSGDAVHDNSLFMAAAITMAARRESTRTFLVHLGELYPSTVVNGGYCDTQQLWTFPVEQIDAHSRIATLNSPHERPILKRIDSLLSTAKGTTAPGSAIHTGDVVWLDVLAGSNMRKSDITAVQRGVEHLIGAPWPIHDMLMPALVLAVPSDQVDGPPLSLLTAVPLIDAPGMFKRHLHVPFVPVFGRSDAHGDALKWAALTQLLITVDYREVPRHRDDNKRWVTDPRRVYLALDQARRNRFFAGSK